MKTVIFFLAAASVLGVGAKPNTGTYKERSCETTYGYEQQDDVPTSVAHIKDTYTIHSTKCVQNVVTVTPKAITTTLKTTKVIKAQVTEKTKTKSVLTKATVFSTITSTGKPLTQTNLGSTVVTVTSIPTTVVPVPDSFVPIQDTFSGSTLEDTDDGVPDEAAASGSTAVIKKKKLANRGSGKSPARPSEFPQYVNCREEIHVPKVVVSTKKKTPITITAVAPLSIILSTVKVTRTSTVYPPEVTVRTTSTITSLATSTIIPTSTITSTFTISNTIVLPTQTSYPQCRHNNFANKNGDRWFSETVSHSQNNNDKFIRLNSRQIFGLADESAYECCASCATSDQCYSGQFIKNIGCFHFWSVSGMHCSETDLCEVVLQPTDQEPADAVVYFNGPDAQWVGFEENQIEESR